MATTNTRTERNDGPVNEPDFLTINDGKPRRSGSGAGSSRSITSGSA